MPFAYGLDRLMMFVPDFYDDVPYSVMYVVILSG